MSKTMALRTRLAILSPKHNKLTMYEWMVQPDLMYVPPVLGTTEVVTYAHNSDIKEGDKVSKVLDPCRSE